MSSEIGLLSYNTEIVVKNVLHTLTLTKMYCVKYSDSEYSTNLVSPAGFLQNHFELTYKVVRLDM